MNLDKELSDQDHVNSATYLPLEMIMIRIYLYMKHWNQVNLELWHHNRQLLFKVEYFGAIAGLY